MTDEWKQRQQIMRRIFEGVLPTAEERNTFHISTTDVRALEQFAPIYKEYFRSEIDDLNNTIYDLVTGTITADDLIYKERVLEREYDINMKHRMLLHHLLWMKKTNRHPFVNN
jgi:hypothetical protein